VYKLASDEYFEMVVALVVRTIDLRNFLKQFNFERVHPVVFS
jgi:hypothetical protein